MLITKQPLFCTKHSLPIYRTTFQTRFHTLKKKKDNITLKISNAFIHLMDPGVLSLLNENNDIKFMQSDITI